MATVGGSLAVVLGLFLLVAWVMRKASPRSSSALPGEVFEVLGRAPLAGRQQVHLLRCGSKLLLVSITPAATETLTEVTDPVEVDRLAGLCRQAHPQERHGRLPPDLPAVRPAIRPVQRREETMQLQDAGRRVGRAWEDDDVVRTKHMQAPLAERHTVPHGRTATCQRRNRRRRRPSLRLPASSSCWHFSPLLGTARPDDAAESRPRRSDAPQGCWAGRKSGRAPRGSARRSR